MTMFTFRAVDKNTAALADGAGTGKTAAENLLMHIPGEASGFYILAIEAMEKPSSEQLWLIGSLAVFLMLLVRVLAKASKAVIFTSLLAFLLWMFVFENGALHMFKPSFLAGPMGSILAAFYSAVVTTLATAGKLK